MDAACSMSATISRRLISKTRPVRYVHEFGLNDLSNYMLYNFHDSPADLFERMFINVRLNEELSIRIDSFPKCGISLLTFQIDRISA